MWTSGRVATVLAVVVVVVAAVCVGRVQGGLSVDKMLDEAEARVAQGDHGTAAEMFGMIQPAAAKAGYGWRANFGAAVANAAAGSYERAMEAADAAARTNTTLDLIFLQGFLHLMNGAPARAVSFLNRANKLDDSRGDAWLYLGNAYDALEEPAKAKGAYAKAWKILRSRKALRALGFAYRALGKTALEERLYAKAVEDGLLRDARQRPDTLTPGLEAKPWHVVPSPPPPPGFAYLARLEADLHMVRAELDAVLAADPGKSGSAFHLVGTGGKFAHDRALYVSSGRKWHQITLFEHGVAGPGAADLFPNTLRVLEHHVPHAVGFGRTVISILEPGVDIVPHTGPTNERLTVHCGLRIPNHLAHPPSITVGGETHGWAVDSCFVFDDSFEHAVHFADVDDPATSGENLRAVLLFHIPHPDTAGLESGARDDLLRMQFGGGSGGSSGGSGGGSGSDEL